MDINDMFQMERMERERFQIRQRERMQARDRMQIRDRLRERLYRDMRIAGDNISTNNNDSNNVRRPERFIPGMFAMDMFRDNDMADIRRSVDLRTNMFSRMSSPSPLTMSLLNPIQAS